MSLARSRQNPATQNALDKLSGVLAAHGYECSTSAGGLQADKHGTPVNLNYVLEPGGQIFFYIHVRIQDWDIPGDRTDATDILTTLLALYIRENAGASCSFWGLPHPAIPGELRGAYLRLDQPNSSRYGSDEDGLRELTELINVVDLFNRCMTFVLDWSLDAEGELRTEAVSESDWERKVCTALRISITSREINCQSRVSPNWFYARSRGLAVVEAPGMCRKFNRLLGYASRSADRIADIAGEFVISGSVQTFVPAHLKKRARTLLRRLGATMVGFQLMPLENGFVAITDSHLLFLSGEGGRRRFRREREKLSHRDFRKRSLLYPATRFQWGELLDADLENLAADLLREEPGVQWVRPVGHPRERDGGRDYLVEWDTIPIGESQREGVPPFVRRDVIVQCKVRARSVGKSEVTDIRDTVEHYRCNGYLLIVSSRLASGLVDHLWELRRRQQIWVEWWTREDLEIRLLKHPEVAAKYRRVVQLLPITDEGA